MKKRKQTGEEIASNRRISQKDSMALRSSTEFPRSLPAASLADLGRCGGRQAFTNTDEAYKSDVSFRIRWFNSRLHMFIASISRCGSFSQMAGSTAIPIYSNGPDPLSLKSFKRYFSLPLEKSLCEAGGNIL